jgi:hypothetical protein
VDGNDGNGQQDVDGQPAGNGGKHGGVCDRNGGQYRPAGNGGKHGGRRHHNHKDFILFTDRRDSFYRRGPTQQQQQQQ